MHALSIAEVVYNSTCCCTFAMFVRVFPFLSFESPMLVTRGASRAGHAPVALTIGNFDGVHTGHRVILERLAREARSRGLQSCVMTFEPHPRDYFAAKLGQPEMAPARIALLRDKLEELRRCGIDQVVILRFDEALASLPAQDFIRQVLVEQLRAHDVAGAHREQVVCGVADEQQRDGVRRRDPHRRVEHDAPAPAAVVLESAMNVIVPPAPAEPAVERNVIPTADPY